MAAEDCVHFNNAIIRHLFLSRHQSYQQSAAGVSQAEVQCGQSAGAPLAAGWFSNTPLWPEENVILLENAVDFLHIAFSLL